MNKILNKTISDGRYLQLTGGTLSAALTVNGAITSSSGVSGLKYLYITNPDGRQTHLPFQLNNQNYIRRYRYVKLIN